jgi:hypothetical protein
VMSSVSKHTSIYEPGYFSIISLVVDADAITNWQIPTVPLSDVNLYSRNLNTSNVDKCHIRFLGLTLKDHTPRFGGTGAGQLSAQSNVGVSSTVDCYYVTNQKTDFPQTTSIAGVCPIPNKHALDWVCSAVGSNDVQFDVALLWKNITYDFSSVIYKASFGSRNEKDSENDTPSKAGQYTTPDDEMERRTRRVLTAHNDDEMLTLKSSVTINALYRRFGIPFEQEKDQSASSASPVHARYLDQLERHAVCTVQVFRNKLTSARLFLFVKYYLTMGWTVIVYDRYGLHADVMREFGEDVQLNYYPFTVFQELFPDRYNMQQHMMVSYFLPTFQPTNHITSTILSSTILSSAV